MVTTVGIVFVWHDGEIRKAGTLPSLRHPIHPCNTLLDGADHPSCHQRGQNGTQASIAIPAPQ
jgi:hypothetical protein